VQHKNCNQMLNCKHYNIKVSKSDLIKAHRACKVWGHSNGNTKITKWYTKC